MAIHFIAHILPTETQYYYLLVHPVLIVSVGQHGDSNSCRRLEVKADAARRRRGGGGGGCAKRRGRGLWLHFGFASSLGLISEC